MKVFITGGTGLIGEALAKALVKRGDTVTILTRNAEKAIHKFGDKVEVCTSLDSLESMDGYDVVVNLAGEPIIGNRWTEDQKKILQSSRWDITRRLTQLIKASKNPPEAFVSGSAVGYYGSQEDNVVTESGNSHIEFTYELCRQWENLALEALSDKTRVCISRTGIVLSPQGGILKKALPIFSKGLGAVLGSGKQYISWIHIDDMVRALIFLMENVNAEGSYNLTAPNPVTNKEFSKTLAKTLNRPCLFWIPRFVLTATLGEVSTLIINGQRVVPERLTNLGFEFKHPQLQEALNNLIGEK